MKDFQKKIYNRKAWQDCRNAYVSSVGGLCEECLKRGLYTPGEEVHHIVPLTPDNCDDPSLVYGFDNMILLCRKCHGARHRKHTPRYTIDEFGNVKGRDVDTFGNVLDEEGNIIGQI